MAAASPRLAKLGPLLVALGAAGWGSDVFFRRNLSLRLGPYQIVLLEHLLQLLLTLPWLLANLRGATLRPRRAYFWVLVSGGIGSSLGTICFTAAMANGSGVNATCGVVLLNLQPVISTVAGALLFHEKIRSHFYPWAAVAILAGAGLVLGDGSWSSLRGLQLSAGYLWVLGTILLWGLATAAGRGAMADLPVGLAAPLRLWAGFLMTAIVLGIRVQLQRDQLPSIGLLHDPIAVRDLLLLSTVAGAIPLFIYFAGLRTTPAAIAGYCEMCYTIAATLVAWAFVGGTLTALQVAAAALLLLAIVKLNGAQRETADLSAT